MKKILLTTLIAMATLFGLQAQVVYVDVNATGTNNGSSWANAYNDMNTAIINANIGSEFWVKAGTYKQFFAISEDATIIGGFNGTETTSSEADPATNEVIFDGDILGNDFEGDHTTNRSDNSPYICFIAVSSSTNEINISGITFKGASATSYSALYINNGSNDNTSKTVNVKNCIFYDNSTNGQDAGGGAVKVMSNLGQSYTNVAFDKCEFKYNGTHGTNNVRGSAMFIYATNFGNTYCKITNCLFNNNTDVAPYGHSCVIYQAASSSGGAVDTYLYNNTFAQDNNSAHPIWYWNGTGASSLTGYFWNNIVDNTFSAVHVGNPGTSANGYIINAYNNLWATVPVNESSSSISQGNNILNSNPGFVDGAGGLFQLASTSPCINTGNPQTDSGPGNLLPDALDLDGNPRFYAGGIIDMGAFEFQGTTSGIEDLEQMVLNVYPNPVSNELNIEVSKTTQIELLNMVGETVLTTILNHKKNTIDVSRLVSGVYFLQTEKGSSTKFIKE